MEKSSGLTTLLIIEGTRADFPAFGPALRKKGYKVEVANSGTHALSILKEGIIPAVIIVSAASMRTTGIRICQSLRTATDDIPIILILDEGVVLGNGEADLILNMPFTVQKLSNRLEHFLPQESDKTIHIGPIRLDIKQKIVRCLGKRTRLTPRLISLLSILMQRHGEVIERKALFSKVWETDYTDDIRTLDVHISWLRRAIEVDPINPKFIKTIRGVGYQLDL